MNIRAVVCSVVLALAPAAALACDNIYGIPADSRIRLLWLDPAAPKVLPTVVAESRCSNSAGHRYAAATVSADGGAIAAWHEKGLEVHFGGRRRLIELGADWSKQPFPHFGVFEWSPDGRRLALTLTEGPEGKRVRRLAVLDARRLGDEQPLRVVSTLAPDVSLLGVEWTPDGEALLPIEYHLSSDEARRERAVTSTTVRRLPLDGGESSPVLSVEGALDFFVSRAHHGRAGGTPGCEALAGKGDDLFAVRPGGRLDELDLPAAALHSIDWHPSRDQVALFYRRPVTNARGSTFSGLYLVDLGGPGPCSVEQLHGGLDVRSLWFSPRGSYLGWSTPTAVCYRPLRDEGDAATVRIEAPARRRDLDDRAELRGCAWSPDEARLAWCADAKVFVRDLATGTDALVAELGDPDARPVAGLPQWVGDRLLVTVFEDADPFPQSPPLARDPREARPPERQR